MGTTTKRWLLILGGATILGLLALVANMTSADQLAGRANGLLVTRLYLSKLVNAGVVWAGIAYVAGWVMRTPVRGAVAGVVASLWALAVHYGVGLATGVLTPGFVAENRSWFLISLVMGVPLALLGVLARGTSRWGYLARFVLPVGALLEPFAKGAFTVPGAYPWPYRVSAAAYGATLLVAGVVGFVLLARIWWPGTQGARPPRPESTRPTASPSTSPSARGPRRRGAR